MHSVSLIFLRLTLSLGGVVTCSEVLVKRNITSDDIDWCRVDVSPTYESPTENSWMLHPLNKASLGYYPPNRCVPTLDRVKHGTSSVGRFRGLGRPPAPTGSVGRLASFAYAPWPGLLNWRPSVGCTLGPHIELHRFAALKRAAVGSRVSLRSIKSDFRVGMDRSVAK